MTRKGLNPGDQKISSLYPGVRYTGEFVTSAVFSYRNSMVVMNTTSGVLLTKTTIWMVGEKYVGVKGNLVIPISAIVDVKI